LNERVQSIIANIDSRGPNTLIAKMFLPWMIAVHGFSYGGAEHRDTAEEILFHILHTHAPKFNIAPEDIVFLRKKGGNAWDTFVRERHVNSGTCFI